MAVVAQGLNLEQLIDLVDGDKDKASSIWDASKMVISYAQFKTIQNLGLTITYDSLPFEKVMMFSWIKEAIEHGRKN